MLLFPAAIETLMHELSRLPGVGRRAAERIVVHLMDSPPERARGLADAIANLRSNVRACARCGAWAEREFCSICADPRRDASRVLVVERPSDIQSFEQSGAWAGLYHVLGGSLSPMRGVMPEDLSVEPLKRRIAEEGVREVVVATSPTVEGDATAHYLAQELDSLGAEVARIGMGLPLGANLGYADPGTLKLALEGRRRWSGGE